MQTRKKTVELGKPELQLGERQQGMLGAKQRRHRRCVAGFPLRRKWEAPEVLSVLTEV